MSTFGRPARVWSILLLAFANVLPVGSASASAAETTLFVGGAQGWASRFGSGFAGSATDPLVIVPVAAVATLTKHIVPACPLTITEVSPAYHAEAQRTGVIGADFTYGGDLSIAASGEAHLQFRIADQGRYGVRLRADGAAFYRLARGPEICDCANPADFTHCPNWPPLPSTSCEESDANGFGCDDPQYQELATRRFSLASGSMHALSVSAQGSHFQVTLDGQPLFDLTDDALRVGRFGIYAFGATEADVKQVRFRNVTATTDPTQLSNFALLYSTAGYELGGTKRALVRTLNDLPESMYIPQPSRFYLTKCRQTIFVQTCDGPVKSGSLTPEATPGNRGAFTIPRTFGMQLLEADFTSLADEEGTYILRVDVGTTSGLRRLWSSTFTVKAGLASATLVKPLTILNAAARRAADDDMRRNWCFETSVLTCTNDPASRGVWSVALDGAFWADRADAVNGAVLRRVFDDNNMPNDSVAPSFRYVGQISIINGCDAQMQFGVTPFERVAVTLLAGAGAGCSLAGGPGAVRLHREGSPLVVPGGREELALVTFPANHPFQAGHPYDVDILVEDGNVTVSVDNGLVQLQRQGVPVRSGGFALKALASTARFARVQAWGHDVDLVRSPARDGTSVIGSRTGRYRDIVVTSTGGGTFDGPPNPVRCEDFLHFLDPTTGDALPHHPLDRNEKQGACYPIFSMLHGFHDANNIIGEATSHGTYLNGLMDVWASRASAFSADEREALREAIQETALYVEELFQTGADVDGFTGEFAHSEMGRGGVDTNLGSYQPLEALYGESAFADKGAFVDRALADRACMNALDGASWLAFHNFLGDPTQKSVIYAHMARCSKRLESQGMFPGLSDLLWNLAANAALDVLDLYRPARHTIQSGGRDTGRVFPWFEGVYEVFRDHREKLGCNPDPAQPCNNQNLSDIAKLLVGHLTQPHACDDTSSGTICPANGFYALPQGSGDPKKDANASSRCPGSAGAIGASIPFINWCDMQSVPLVDRPISDPGSNDPEKIDFVHAYNIQGHVPAAVSDSVYLWRMTGNDGLEKVAAGNYYWMFGLNPGVPSQKVVAADDGSAWRAAAFVRALDKPFSRVFEGYRIQSTSSKGWLSQWEGNAASPHREAWFVDPANTGFVSTVNGHVLWDGQWDYWNVGKNGWASGETFILGDGALLKAAILYEDRATPSARDNPYDTTRLAFFDTTHVDRLDSGWLFDDPDHTLYAQAGRASTGFCDDKGYNGGRFTGHYVGERDGVLCVPSTAHFFDATDAEIDATGWGYDDINGAAWAQIARAATNFCVSRGYVGGFSTGHQDKARGLRGTVCAAGDVANEFDSTRQDLDNSGEGFADINAVGWAQAARAATNICLGKGYSGGFFTGHQIGELRGVVCLRG